MSSTPRIAVFGLWHLGCVTAACCARHFSVVGLDFDAALIARLREGHAPLFEPGLDALIASHLVTNKISFTTDPKEACANADILWLTYDTPVNDADESDVAYVLEKLRRCLAFLPAGALVLISSQLPAGTCRALEAEFPQFHFACSPENLRLGRALDAFEKADRVVVGLRDDTKKEVLKTVFSPFTPQILFMRSESAEMVKHALNSFLAVSITFINEIARLCEQVGADAKEVSAGLKSDVRIGPKAYLGPGGPFAGGTLARDVVTLTKLAKAKGETIELIPAIKRSNDQHRSWALRRLQVRLGSLRGKSIAILGLTYTPNTSTLRRSAAVELCQQIHAEGGLVKAFDPAVKTSSPEISTVTLAPDLAGALRDADAAAVCTEWPEFRAAPWSELVQTMRLRVIVDANRFLEKELQSISNLEHISVGRATADGSSPAS